MEPDKRKELVTAIAQAINRCSVEHTSNTPDFILAEMLVQHLEAFTNATKQRAEWYGEGV